MLPNRLQSNNYNYVSLWTKINPYDTDVLSSNQSKQGQNSRTEKVAKTEIELDLSFMAPDLVNIKCQIICLQVTSVTEGKTNCEMEGHIDLRTWVILFSADA